MADVYFSKDVNEKFINKLKDELKKEFLGAKKVAVKIHMGEINNKNTLTPIDLKPVIQALKELGFEPFFYDSPVAYPGVRHYVATYKKFAQAKGWTKLAPVSTTEDYVEQKMQHLTYQVCKPLSDADAVLVVTHLKGHVCTGFGGAIKNLGMGALTKKSKSDIHDGGKPKYTKGCIQCKLCEINCPIKGIKVTDKPEFRKCYGCSNCHYICPEKCIDVKVADFDTLLSEGAAAAIKNFKKQYYVTFIKNIAKECDCVPLTSRIIAKDAGMIMSKDIVAIEKAAHDLIKESEGKDVFLEQNQKTGLKQIEIAEKTGMGNQKYKLIKI